MLSRFVSRLEEGAIALLLGGMVAVTFSQVVARYVFNTGAVWALELTTTFFAWMVLLGVSYGVKTGAHLGVDAFVRMLPDRFERTLVVFVGFCCCVYAGIMLFGAWDYWSKIYRFGILTEDLYVPRIIVEAIYGGAPDYRYEEIGIPRWVRYAALPLGMALLLFRFLQATVLIALGKRELLIAGHEAEEAVAEAQVHLQGADIRSGRES
ncbi:MAG: TRAP transporter small permease subunit [Kiloniellaceae bacterium]|nr:TRAP transporter small permease subunit [Kiloniellaceae bacterium]